MAVTWGSVNPRRTWVHGSHLSAISSQRHDRGLGGRDATTAASAAVDAVTEASVVVATAVSSGVLSPSEEA